MIRLMGAVCIVGGCGYAGLKLGAIYKKRVEILRSLQNGLNLLAAEISYQAVPLPQALRRVGLKMDGAGRSLFCQAADILAEKKGLTAGEAWETSVVRFCREAPLKEEDVNIISMFGGGLGNSAREEQLKNIMLTREQLRMAEQKAVEEREKNQRIWQYMGFCMGAVFVLILV